ncbi:hypothetical protein CVD28_04430 [Bacillus sp. M6-12]|uniref:hypothetical protein n=1 Tax=Bacillus sp. M6-12 TaxID=2054166 RepID=UPI000C76F705|nr:hypothetical protein [Bacillus sp. M6-12]PLS19668.1 hypothetical protein CVD28_04430 [Bacillus sp. M6-12]
MKDIIIAVNGSAIFFMIFGLMTVVWYYQLRNQGSVGQPMRDMYKMNLYMWMPLFTIAGLFIFLVKGMEIGLCFLIPVIPFYCAVFIIHYLMKREYAE